MHKPATRRHLSGSRPPSLLRSLAALAIACVMGVGSCTTASVLGSSAGRETSGWGSLALMLAPFAIGAVSAGVTYHLLLVGEREDLVPRRRRRPAPARRTPHPVVMGALAGVLVLAAAGVYFRAFWNLGIRPHRPFLTSFDDVVTVVVLGGGVLLAIPVALVVGVVTARARARQNRAPDRDTGPPGM